MHYKKISEAENKISSILKNLEKDLDILVDNVAISDIDVTTISDNKQRLVRSINISTHRKPGHNWR